MALLLQPSKLAHAVGVPGGLDVAYLDAQLVVIASTHLRPFAVALPRRHARAVLEAESGAFERWQLQVGDMLEISVHERRSAGARRHPDRQPRRPLRTCALEVLVHADIVCCEDTRHTGRLLARSETSAQRLVARCTRTTRMHASAMLLDELGAGKTVALVSDAGTPLISDPGERLVKAAIAAGVVVSVVPGPTAAIAALVISGLSTDRWRFEGFLDRKGGKRRARLAEIASSPVPSICYEAPHRLSVTLVDLEAVCGPARMVVVARELTKLHEEVWRGPLGEARSMDRWNENKRGEFVLDSRCQPRPGSRRNRRTSSDAIRGLVRRAGLARRDAVIAVEHLLGVPHRIAYNAALSLERLQRCRAPTDVP